MKPTDEQLRDPGWWDRVAPDGATHISWASKSGGIVWYKIPGDGRWDFQFKHDECKFDNWRPGEGDPVNPHLIERPTPRPTAWQGGGLPPEGKVCETAHPVVATIEDSQRFITLDTGFEVTVSGYADFGRGEVVVFCGYVEGKWFYGFQRPSAFKPLRTKEEVEREEAVEKAMEERPVGLSNHEYMILSRYTGRIYDAGRLRKPMSREEANEALSKAFRDVPFSVSQRTALLDALGF